MISFFVKLNHFVLETVNFTKLTNIADIRNNS